MGETSEVMVGCKTGLTLLLLQQSIQLSRARLQSSELWVEVDKTDREYNPARGFASDEQWEEFNSQKQCLSVCETPCRVSEGQLLPEAPEVAAYSTLVGVGMASY